MSSAFPSSAISANSDFNIQGNNSVDTNSNYGCPNSMNASAIIGTNQNTDHDERCLFVATTTWTRDSHELFDYEARQVNRKSYELKRAAKVFRTALEVQVIPDGQPLPTQSADFLLSIREREGKFTVVPADRNLQVSPGSVALMPKKLWLIVKQLPGKNHQLQETDVIKLGRFKLRVKQLVKSGTVLPELRLDDVETPHSTVTEEEAATMQCRICLLDGGTTDDPLLCPCQCKGSIKFVHLDCLRRWISGRLSLSDEQQRASFFFKQLHCELCKSAFPSTFNLNNAKIPIVEFPKIEPPFIILENINANRGLHVVSMNAKKELKLGRGHESDVRIADVSISRYHATIRFSDGEFILEDHNSKFGTLVSLRKIQPVEETHALAVQVGRTIINFLIRKPLHHFEDVIDLPVEPVSEVEPEDENQSGGPPGGSNNHSGHQTITNVRQSGHSTNGGHQSTTTASYSHHMDSSEQLCDIRSLSMSRLCSLVNHGFGRRNYPLIEDRIDRIIMLNEDEAQFNTPLLQQLVPYEHRSRQRQSSSSMENQSFVSNSSFPQSIPRASMPSSVIAHERHPVSYKVR